MKKIFSEETGMYVDWAQIERLPDVSTIIDIGVGPSGTPDLYRRFSDSELILIDPLDEAEAYFLREIHGQRSARFIKVALGEEAGEADLIVEPRLGRSTLLQVTEINHEAEPLEIRPVALSTLDATLEGATLYDVGIKIDVEGSELS